MRVLRWLPEALEDLKRLHAFVEAYSPRAATRAIHTVVASAERLLEFPEMGRPWAAESSFRELLVKFGTRGYVIRYRLLEDQVVVARVWHALEQR